MIKLSTRLQAVADLVPFTARAADIGSDHALLPAYLVQSGKSPSAIAGEVNDGPLQAAKLRIEAEGLGSRISARKGDGLAVLMPGEADCVTISGMGGALIASILEEGRAAGKLDEIRTLVLQPNVGEDIVRRWLLGNGWYLHTERLLEEDGKRYEILAASRVPDAAALNAALYDPSFLQLAWEEGRKREWLLRIGPWLLRQPDALLALKWRDEQRKLAGVLAQVNRSHAPEAGEKAAALQEQIEAIEEVLQCMHMDRLSRS